MTLITDWSTISGARASVTMAFFYTDCYYTYEIIKMYIFKCMHGVIKHNNKIKKNAMHQYAGNQYDVDNSYIVRITDVLQVNDIIYSQIANNIMLSRKT